MTVGAYQRYLDKTAGSRRWVMLDMTGAEPSTVDHPLRIRFLCPLDALTALKWADIRDGERRVLIDRELSPEEAQLIQVELGPFPWEQLAR